LVAALTFGGPPQLADGTVDKRQVAFTGFVHGKLL
jgi:hypothetical protein